MRVPQTSTLKKTSQMFVCFILGGIIGSLIILYMYGHLMDEIVSENRQLTLNYANLQDDYSRIEESMNEMTKYQQNMTIKKINIEVDTEGTDSADIHGYSLVETEVINRLRKDLKFLIHLPMQSVAETSAAITQLINGRRYEIQQQKIGVELNTLVIYSTVTVKVSIIKVD